jgi:ABC-type transporter MlaC component
VTTYKSLAFARNWLRSALFIVLTGLAAIALPGAGRASDQTDAVALVQQVRQTAISFSRSGSEAEKRVIDAAFDGAAIGRTVLGMYWSTASAADRAALIDALLDAIARGIADRLANTREQDFVVLGTQVLSNGDVLVRSQFVRPIRQPTAVDWRLHRCGGKLCIGDVIVDGASVTVQRRDQVMAQLAGNGGSIPRLITDIREGRL